MTTEKNIKMEAIDKLKAIRKELGKRRVSARQDGDFSFPAEGQLHHLGADYGMPEAFVLITRISGCSCSVIPGSFDAMQGGPDDLVLPESVLGDYVTLAMDLATELPFKSIGKGFAALDDATFQSVLRALDEFNEGKLSSDFQYALPYIGKSDRRIAYHRQLCDVIDNVCKVQIASARKTISVWRREACLAAAAASQEKDICLDFKVQDMELVLQIEYSRTEKKIVANVFDKNGEYSSALDGCMLLGVKYAMQCMLKNGHAEMACPDDMDDCQLSLCKEDGTALALESVRQ